VDHHWPLGCDFFGLSDFARSLVIAKMVVDTKYYDVLQVPPNADELAIKKVFSSPSSSY
jgi:hypothetical protein